MISTFSTYNICPIIETFLRHPLFSLFDRSDFSLDEVTWFAWIKNIYILTYETLEVKDIFCLSAASIGHLTGTRILISGDSTYHCQYHPPLSQANLTGLQQV